MSDAPRCRYEIPTEEGPRVPDPDEVPEEQRERDQWLMWDADNDTEKQPHWRGDFGISWSDPDDWHTFEEVHEAAQERDSWGIGYVMAADNDDAPRGIYGCIDLDGCVESEHESGSKKDWVPAFHPLMGEDPGFVEWSPSGEGLHIPLAGFETPEWWSDKHFSDDEHEGVEVLTNKFVTVTGDKLRGTGDDVGDYDDGTDEWLAQAHKAITGEDPREGSDADLTDYDSTGSSTRGDWFDADVAAEALDHIDPDVSYPTWRDIGFALADEFPSSRAKRLFTQWSRSGSKWDNEAKRQADRIIDDASSGGGRTISTVVYKAKQGGWDASQAARENTTTAEADGGTTTTTVAAETGTEQPDEDSFEGRMQSARYHLSLSQTKEGDRRDRATGIDTAAGALCDELDFVYPRERTRGWRERLYVYADGEHVGYGDEAGVYEPSGDRTVEQLTERHLADAADTGVLKQIVEKCKRRSDTRERRLRANPERMVVENGILDLETGNVDPHSPDEYHKTRIDVAYDPDAECPAIDEFTHDIVADEDVDTVYRLISHTLYKDYPGEKAAMLLGDGANGKTIFLTLIQRFLGDHNTSGESLQDLNSEQFSERNLLGKLANIDPDMGNQTVDNMATFKELSGGDTTSADVKYERPVRFDNYATMLFACNDIPVLDDDTHGNWRRWIMLDFPNTFRPGDDDYIPKDELLDRITTEEELEGLLARCVEEISEWAQSDRKWFPSVDEPEEVRRRMRKASEPVFAFAEDCPEPDEDGRIEKADLRTLYNQYATENGLEKVSKEQFGERILGLTDYHIESERPTVAGGKRPRLYTGIELSEYGKRLDTDDEDDVNASITEGVRSSGTNSDLSMKEAVIQLLQDNDGQLPLAELSGLALKEHGLAPDETHDVLNSLRRDGRVMNDDRHNNRFIVHIRQ